MIKVHPRVLQELLLCPYGPKEDLPTMADIEAVHLLRTLKTLEFHLAKTAQALDMAPRTVREKINELRRLGVDIPASPNYRPRAIYKPQAKKPDPRNE